MKSSNNRSIKTMKWPMSGGRKIGAGLAAGASLVVWGAAIAQAQNDPILARAQVVGTLETCPVILVNFQTPLALSGHSGEGQRLSVSFSRDGNIATPSALPPESQPPLSVPGLGVVNISFDPNGSSPRLLLNFESPVETKITQSGPRSVVVALTAPGDATNCFAPTEEAELDVEGEDTAVLPAPDLPGASAVETGASEGDDMTLVEARALLTEARAAITAGDYRLAIQRLTKATSLPENALSPDAQELLGLARERNQQLAHATAEYEAYLEKYPDGEAADRVRQRLAAIRTAQAAPAPSLRSADGIEVSGNNGLASEALTVVSVPRAGDTFRPLGAQPGFAPLGDQDFPQEEEQTFHATLSVDYSLNQATTSFTELDTATTDNTQELLDHSVAIGVDMSDEYKIGDGTLAWRMDGNYEFDLNGSDNRLNLSRVYGEYEFYDDGPLLRIGRQSRSEGGILGRFDGAYLYYPIDADFAANAVVGLPVDSKSDGILQGNRYIAGASIDYLGLGENNLLSAYVVGEMREGFANRFAIGLEGTYSTESDMIYGMVDYDLLFNQLNIARLSWTRRFADQSSLTATADYRFSPLLTLSNALQGQTATTLTDLSATYSFDEMLGLARDRAMPTVSLAFNYQRPLSEQWQVSGDLSINYTGGSPASGGVDAVAASGLEYYASGQLVGSGVLLDNDLLSVSVRYANTASSDLYLLDTYWRFDVNDSLRLKPRLRMAHRDRASDGGTEDFAIGSLGLSYDITDSMSLDVEVGDRYTISNDSVSTTHSNETYIFAGFWSDF